METQLRLQSYHLTNASPSCLHLLSGRVSGAWAVAVAVASGGSSSQGLGHTILSYRPSSLISLPLSLPQLISMQAVAHCPPAKKSEGKDTL